jgi:hypothetical protein
MLYRLAIESAIYKTQLRLTDAILFAIYESIVDI